jgi:hypothetical protein
MPAQSLASPTSPSSNQGPAPTSHPLVRALGLQQLLQRDAEKPPEAQSIDDTGSLSALASHCRAAWGRNKLAKMKIDLKLLDCLRARRGLYSPSAIAAMQANQGGMNIVWADLTETKCRAASAWIREIVLPVGEQPWGIEPTPMPDMPKELMKSVVGKALQQATATMQQIQQAGGGTLSKDEFRGLAAQIGDKLRDQTETQLRKTAAQRAKRMEAQIADRLVEGDYEPAMDGFVEDFVTYPAAILKGPIYKRHKTLSWGSGWKPEVSNNPAQSYERVSPFDAYPAPSARTCQQGDFIERIRFRREELHDLKGLPDYKDNEIDKALMDYSNGHLEGWLWTEAERQRLEQETLYMWLSPPGVIDALNYWGSVPGWKLLSWGVHGKKGEDIEPTRDYEVNVLVCGRYILYAAMNPDPLDHRPYRKACYDEIPGAFWGRSIPDLCATSQKMCNGIACALADNMSMASGPMVWVHADRMADGENTLEIYPWKIVQLKSDPTQGVNPGMGFWQAQDNSASLMATYEKWELRADDATGIPRYTYGNENAGGSADTATGLSMLMNNAAKGLRRAISNIDLNVISPTIGDTFTNEMLYNPDLSIKGDCIVVPRGAAAILIKESAQQRRTQFLQMVTTSPVITQILGPKYIANIVREVATAMELPVDECVPSEDEVETQIAQQGQQAAQAAQAAAASQAQIEQNKEQAQGQREQQTINAQTISNIVQFAVETAINRGATPGGIPNVQALESNAGETLPADQTMDPASTGDPAAAAVPPAKLAPSAQPAAQSDRTQY